MKKAYSEKRLNDGKLENDAPAAQPPKSPKCPLCQSSSRVVKDGMRYSSGDGQPIQRWLCKNCEIRFSQPNVKLNVLGQLAKPLKNSSSWQLNTTSNILLGRRVCELAEGSKNLVQEQLTDLVGEKSKGKILEFAWQLQRRGLSEQTIKQRTYALNILINRGADLLNAESVETILAVEKWTPANKLFLVMAYRSFTKTFNIQWTPVKVNYQRKQPFIPLESEIDALISGCGRRTATLLQVLKDCGCRIGEACNLRWTDIDTEKNLISVNFPEKGSASRTIKVSDKTINMIEALPKNSERLFNANPRNLQSVFDRQRKKLADKLQNPRLKQIHFHTFRHFKATMTYHKTRSLPLVKYILGHKCIQNTDLYTHLVNFENDEYDSATARTPEEMKQLIESGFEYVTDLEGVKWFRKRK